MSHTNMVNRDVLPFRVSKSVSKGRHKEQLCSSDTAMKLVFFTGEPLSFNLQHKKVLLKMFYVHSQQSQKSCYCRPTTVAHKFIRP